MSAAEVVVATATPTTTPTSSIDKMVRFKEKVRVRRVPTRASMSAELKSELWVSKEEILKQAQGCKRDFNFLVKLGLKLPEDDEVIEDISKLYLDGLESSQEKAKRHARMFRAMHSVLDEQTKQFRHRQMLARKNAIAALNNNSPPVVITTPTPPPLNPLEMEQQIALRYSKFATESADLARERGVNQAQSLEEKREDDDESSIGSSSTTKKRGRPSIFDRLKGTAAATRRSPRRPSIQSSSQQERVH